MRPVRLPASGFRRTPWKNGGGVTLDIADEYRPGTEPGSWTGMVWRFGRTTIGTPGPFSDLGGYDRILTVVTGRGLVLHAPDGAALDIREPLRPAAFPGERVLRSELEAGPVEVVNLIGDRSAVTIGVDVLCASEAIEVTADDVVLYAPTADAVALVGGERWTIMGGDAIRFRPQGAVSCECPSGTLLAAKVTRRAGASRA